MDIGKMWDDKFTRDGYFYGKKSNVFLAKNLHLLEEGSSILFLGEGEGRSACYAASKGFRVSAIDASEVGLAKCRALAKELHVEVETHQVDLDGYTYTKQYDAVFTSFLHLMEPLRTQAFREAIGTVKCGGYFVAEFFSTAQMPRKSGGPKNIDLLYSVESFQKIVEPLHVETILLEEVEDFLDEGDGHRGDALLIRVIVKKL